MNIIYLFGWVGDDGPIDGPMVVGGGHQSVGENTGPNTLAIHVAHLITFVYTGST